jgi:ATP-dependent DNA helicase RecG
MDLSDTAELRLQIAHFLAQGRECEWLEFKHNNAEPEMIGEYISALANSAALAKMPYAYVIWGINDADQSVLGTSFAAATTKIGNEELENWLLRLLNPRVHFTFQSVDYEGQPLVVLQIHAAHQQPVKFKSEAYIRVGSYKKKLKDCPEKERLLWKAFEQSNFEDGAAASALTAEQITQQIDYPAYFELQDLPLPSSRARILEQLAEDDLIQATDTGKWDITNLGAVLFARQLSDFKHLKRKAMRVILYKGINRIETLKEIEGNKGYASGFEGLIGYITNLLPSNEVIGQALRKDVPMFPELAIRELVANALIHQDFSITGTGPMIEIFEDRMEISNPGLPLVKPERFLNSPPKSRNEAMASFLRRVGICEERGSGIDKVVFQTEYYQLPAPIFEVTEQHTVSVLFAPKPFREMKKADRVRACYLHACLKLVQRELMTNNSLRERFNLEVENSAMISRIIKQTMEANLIKLEDETVGTKSRRYLPWWA